MFYIDVPTRLADTPGSTLAGVCARHGEPVVKVRDVNFRRRLPGWLVMAGLGVFVLTLVSAAIPLLLIFPVIALLVVVKVGENAWRGIHVSWPYCGRCITRHRRANIVRRVVALFAVLDALATARHIGSTGLDGTAAFGMLGLAIAILVLAIVVPAFSWQRLARAQVSRDFVSVRVDAHPQFLAEVRDRLAQIS